MSISQKDINNIVNCIKNQALYFFKNDIKLEIIDIQDIQNNSFSGHFSSIELIDNIKLIINLNIEDQLFDKLFNEFFKDTISDADRKELVDALPDEIINIIVGLSINSFPKQYRELVLGLPMKLNKNQIKKMFHIDNYKSCKITTEDGSLFCTVIYVKNISN